MSADRFAPPPAGTGHDTVGGASPVVENAITQRFLARWATLPPNRLRELAQESGLPYSFGNRFLTRPAFLPAARRAQLQADAGALLDLLFTLPGRLFDGDLAAMSRVVGLAPAQTEAIVRTATEHPVRLARADFFDDGQSFKLLEFNVSSALGGWDAPILARFLLRDPNLASFVADEGLLLADPLAGFAEVVHAECAGLDASSKPVVALVDWPASFLTYRPTLEFLARCLDPFGLSAVACHAGQLTTRGGHLYLDGRHVDVAYRFIQLGDLLDGPDAMSVVRPIIAAAERGTVRLVTGFSAGVFASKGSLALLYDDEYRTTFSPAERDLIDRVLPWTVMLRAGTAPVAGQQVDLVDYALANRSRLVLKPALLSSGDGVLLGWKTCQRDWADAVRVGLRGDFVLQHRVYPVLERFPAGEGTGASDQPGAAPAGRMRGLVLNWGVFVAGSGYAGALVRALPDADPGVINAHTGAASSCTFHAPDLLTRSSPQAHKAHHVCPGHGVPGTGLTCLR